MMVVLQYQFIDEEGTTNQTVHRILYFLIFSDTTRNGRNKNNTDSSVDGITLQKLHWKVCLESWKEQHQTIIKVLVKPELHPIQTFHFCDITKQEKNKDLFFPN